MNHNPGQGTPPPPQPGGSPQCTCFCANSRLRDARGCPHLSHHIYWEEKPGLVTGQVGGPKGNTPALRKAFTARNPPWNLTAICCCLHRTDPSLTSDFRNVSQTLLPIQEIDNQTIQTGCGGLSRIPSELWGPPSSVGITLCYSSCWVSTAAPLEHWPGSQGAAQSRLPPESSRSILAPQKASLEVCPSDHCTWEANTVSHTEMPSAGSALPLGTPNPGTQPSGLSRKPCPRTLASQLPFH